MSEDLKSNLLKQDTFNIVTIRRPLKQHRAGKKVAAKKPTSIHYYL